MSFTLNLDNYVCMCVTIYVVRWVFQAYHSQHGRTKATNEQQKNKSSYSLYRSVRIGYHASNGRVKNLWPRMVVVGLFSLLITWGEHTFETDHYHIHSISCVECAQAHTVLTLWSQAWTSFRSSWHPKRAWNTSSICLFNPFTFDFILLYFCLIFSHKFIECMNKIEEATTFIGQYNAFH